MVQAFRSKDFYRVRLGVGRPPGRQDPADYVLELFEYQAPAGSTPDRIEPCDVGTAHLCLVVDDLRRNDGFGLTTLQERASILGADLDVVSRPGRGTRVQLNWPLPPDLVARSEQPAELAAS